MHKQWIPGALLPNYRAPGGTRLLSFPARYWVDTSQSDKIRSQHDLPTEQHRHIIHSANSTEDARSEVRAVACITN